MLRLGRSLGMLGIAASDPEQTFTEIEEPGHQGKGVEEGITMRPGIIVVALAWLMSGVCIATDGPGSPEHTYQTVAAEIVVKRSCVSVKGKGARILLSKNELIELSRNQGRPYWSEEERLALIAGNRAAILLDSLTSDQDASGCSLVSLGDFKHQLDAMYLVGRLIEKGGAVIIRDGSRRAETSVVIHDYNGHVSGFRSYDFVGGGTFLSIPTWVS
ncbi:hypothetical protein [Dyella sp. Tek66A03]|uniref:hypothetical protein n=1 Tax=Dyella sp. Tek66A03 TaxID=3458298 RepID=UPI00403E881E